MTLDSGQELKGQIAKQEKEPPGGRAVFLLGTLPA